MQTQTVSRTEHADTQSHWGETLSAFMDGESQDTWPVDLDTATGRQTWNTYHLIGDVLRSPELAITTSERFRVRLSRAIEDEMPIVAAPRRNLPVRLGLSGLAVAAAVASVVWVAQPYFTQPETPAGVQTLAEATPADMPGLGDYLEAHRQVAGPSAVRQVSFEPGGMR
ncbi:sigma-E factor negative regulatory protein [Orrella sp. JC864]|uniref:sigma-E factor negative regulatory protein n=1 Tax=Orrella sp. JC864 TaxID=3120298 RepID=UPI0012BB4C0A